MKKKIEEKRPFINSLTLSRLFTLTLLLALSGCQSPSEIEFDRAKSQQKSGNFERALVHLRKAIVRAEDRDMIVSASLLSAKISEKQINNYRQAIDFLRKVIEVSIHPPQRVQSQKKIAELTYTKLNDYEQSVFEINRVLDMEENLEPSNKYRLLLARSLFYLKRFFQAEVEVNSVIRTSESHEQLFESHLLLGNIYQAAGKSDKAIELFKHVVSQFPELAKKKKVAFNLALTLEERGEFKKAIEILKSIRDDYPAPQYIDIKVERLTQRLRNLPGAQGLKK